MNRPYKNRKNRITYDNKIIVSYLLIVCLAIITFSCDSNKDKGNERLARVGDEYLYLSDLKDVFPKDATEKDSASITTTFINNWIHSKLLLKKAELNIENQQEEFEKRIKDYKNSLLIYSYEKSLIKQQLDTVVSQSDISKYYAKNKDDFDLKEDIVKSIYAKLNKQAAKQNQLKKILRHLNENSFIKLNKYLIQQTTQFHLDTTHWIPLSDLNKQLPQEDNYTNNDFKAGRHLKMTSDSLYNYYLYVFDYKLQNTISPLKFVEERIRNIIINKRKVKLLKQMKADIYNRALKKKQFDVYYKVKE